MDIKQLVNFSFMILLNTFIEIRGVSWILSDFG